jgi:hypothetical protein
MGPNPGGARVSLIVFRLHRIRRYSLRTLKVTAFVTFFQPPPAFLYFTTSLPSLRPFLVEVLHAASAAKGLLQCIILVFN